MKRSGIKRKTPLKAGTKRMKRSRLRQVSAKRRKAIDVYGPLRDKWARGFLACWYCGKLVTRNKLDRDQQCYADVHEFIGGPLRDQTFKEPCMWGLPCRECHDTLPSVPNREQLVMQLARKFLYDHYHFNLARTNCFVRKLGIMAPISVAEINAAVGLLQTMILIDGTTTKNRLERRYIYGK